MFLKNLLCILVLTISDSAFSGSLKGKISKEDQAIRDSITDCLDSTTTDSTTDCKLHEPINFDPNKKIDGISVIQFAFDNLYRLYRELGYWRSGTENRSNISQIIEDKQKEINEICRILELLIKKDGNFRQVKVGNKKETWNADELAVRVENLDLLRAMQGKGVTFFSMQIEGKPLIFYALAKKNTPALIQFLLNEKGAQPRILDENGNTPLIFALNQYKEALSTFTRAALSPSPVGIGFTLGKVKYFQKVIEIIPHSDPVDLKTTNHKGESASSLIDDCITLIKSKIEDKKLKPKFVDDFNVALSFLSHLKEDDSRNQNPTESADVSATNG